MALIILLSVLCVTPVAVSAEDGSDAAASQNSATTYIKDIMLVGDENSYNCEALKNQLASQGWKFIDSNLNKGTSGYTIYLAYQTTTDPTDAVLDISLTLDEDKVDSYESEYGTYKAVRTEGKDFDGELNKGTIGTSMYMYYTKGEGKHCFLMPLTELRIDGEKLDGKELSMNYVDDFSVDGFSEHYGANLNKGNFGDDIYLHFKREFNGTNWMSGLDDNVFLSDLSIPGVHDAVCYQIGWFNDTYAQTQNHYLGSGSDYKDYFGFSNDVSTRGLFDRGIRAIDIRIKTPVTYDTLITGHGPEDARLKRDFHGVMIALDLTLEQVWNWIADFLKTNPTETIIIYASEEDNRTTAQRAYNFFKEKAEAKDSIIWSGDHVPTLGEVRGKVVFHSNLGGTSNEDFRIGDTDKYWGIRYSIGYGSDAGGEELGLEKNAETNLYEVWGENHYVSITRDEKLKYHVLPALKGAKKIRDEAAKKRKRVWSITYTSANNFLHGFWSPAGFARTVNPAVKDYLRKTTSYCGVVLMDFAEDDLANAVWQINYKSTLPKGTYSLSFDSNGGSSVPTQFVAEGASAVEPPAPTKAGSHFMYWQIKGTTLRYDFSRKMIVDLELEAVWRDNTGSIEYVNQDGVAQTPEFCCYVTHYGTTLNDGWYYLDDDISDSMTVKGNANLILKNGSTLKGTLSVNSGASLTIWGQQNSTGTIDNTKINVDGNLTINGGIIKVEGKSLTPAIAVNGNLTINGGNVDAKNRTSTAIGSTTTLKGSIVINGGTVRAEASTNSFGIPCVGIGATQSSTGTIRINGGNVTAIGKNNCGIGAGNQKISISWSKSTDSFYCNSYDYKGGGYCSYELNKTFVFQDEPNTLVKKPVNGRTLVPHTHTMNRVAGVEPSCEADGTETYYYCSACRGRYSDIKGENELLSYPVAIPAKGHDWDNPDFEWLEEGKTLRATSVCKNDGNHTISELCDVTKETVTESDCTHQGKINTRLLSQIPYSAPLQWKKSFPQRVTASANGL